MASVTGIDFVALQVRDLAVSATFYREQLKLEPAPDSPPNAVVFQTKPIPFAVRVPAIDLDASPRLGWGVALWFQCENADSLCAAMQAQGVPIVQPPSDGPFGRMFAFADPDGYVITMHGSRG